MVTFFRKRSGCDAVGIRLKDGDDYPYFETMGFPRQFVRSETHLCLRNEAGQVNRDSGGYPIMECMCGAVIQGRTNSLSRSSPGTEASGPIIPRSFWPPRPTRTAGPGRGTGATGKGTGSVALIPLRVGEATLGLLQLNGRRKGMYSIK